MRFDDVFICYSDLKTILKGIDSSTTSKELARYVFELYAGADIGSIDMSKLKTGMIDEYNYMDDFQETDWIKEAFVASPMQHHTVTFSSELQFSNLITFLF